MERYRITPPQPGFGCGACLPLADRQTMDVHIHVIVGRLCADLSVLIDGFPVMHGLEAEEICRRAFQLPRLIREDVRFSAGGIACHEYYFRYLTAVNHIKQEVFPESLSWVFFDEFIPTAYRKLPGVDSEGDAVRTIVKTIEHDSVRSRKEKGLKPVRVILAGNPVTWNNPMLSYFHINGLLGYGCHRAGPGVAWEWLPPVDVDDVERSLGADVHQSAAGINSAASFVKKAPRDSPLWMTVRLGEMTFRVSRSGSDFYVSKGRHAEGYEHGTLDGLRECEICIDESARWDILVKYCWKGKVFYDSPEAKFDFLNRMM